MGQFIKIESDYVGISKNTYLPKSDQDGVYNWSQNRLWWGRGSERPVAHTQQKLPKYPPPGKQNLKCIIRYNIECCRKYIGQICTDSLVHD